MTQAKTVSALEMTLAQSIKPTSQGKVRDLYDLGDSLLFVASDRISAFDYVLPSTIPYKGQVLTRLSLFWFELLSDLVPNHLLSANTKDLPSHFAPFSDELQGRFMLVRKAKMFPLECIVRGYLAGSGLAEYKSMKTVCGLSLPSGLLESSKLESPIYTPSTKADIGKHDENISYEQSIKLVGEKDAASLREKSIAIYSRARDYAAKRGIIIADTKFEFGVIDNAIVLADEVLTPDSSRFWPQATYAAGKSQPSFDKQFVRDWLSANWDRSVEKEPPSLPNDIVQATSEKYIQAYEMLTGRKFEAL
ncbi:MAG: phosphoribosylaminoimidazolesuccinocarboxamide synthase [Coriobacteriales bacterium]|jgi:phosphoribosylaminoimidazole-succinocarboxamide synthase|nr:phosphoribosylaminoimidazolesuccinocarboxamide synthase [Coriobacteriales bacterium]